MTTCLKCGAENPPAGKYCVRCELPLPHSGVGETLTGGTPRAASTLPGGGAIDLTLAVSAPSRSSEASQRPAHGLPGGSATPERDPRWEQTGAKRTVPHGKAALQQTLLGVAPTAPPPPPLAASVPLDAGHRTLLGIPARSKRSAERPAQRSSEIAQVRGEPAASEPSAAARPGFEPVRAAALLGSTTRIDASGQRDGAPYSNATLLELAPGAVSTAQLARGALERTALAPPEAPPAGGAPGTFKTALGVALPGIAPLRPGGAPPQPEPPQPATQQLLAATRLEGGTTFLGVRARTPRGALVLLISGGVLLISAVVFAVLWKGPNPLSAIITTDASGNDRVDVVCESCPDGTRLAHGDVTAEVRERKAYLTLKQPLPLGEHVLTFDVTRPGGKAETVEVTLPPVEYRIHADTTTLVGDQPRLTLRVNALPGSSVQIGGAQVALDASSRGQTSLDVSEHLAGSARDVVTVEQRVSYVITPPSGKRYSGELEVKFGVTPLLLDAPGSDTVTDLDRFMLAGRTARGAEVWVLGSALSVDASGRFAQLMSIDSVGETKVTLRASQPGLAPRFVSFRLRRVKDLRAEFASLKATALPLATATADVEGHTGRVVIARGKAEEVKIDGHRTYVILASDECAERFCLARLTYGGLRKIERGEYVTAIGRLVGSAGVGSGRAPDIEVTLLQ